MAAEWLTQIGSRSTFGGVPTDTSGLRVQFYDTTLRDGEQQSGVIFSTEQKVRIFRALESAGVPMIETGMIGVGEIEAEVVRALAAEGTTAKRYVLARCAEADVRLAAESGAQGVTLEFPSNAALMKAVLGWEIKDAIEKAVAAIGLAKELGMTANVFAIDSSRTEPETLAEIFSEVCRRAEPEYLTLADTFGVCTPQAAAKLVSTVREVSGPTEVQVHFHDDFMLATANNLAAAEAGATVVQGTWNGLGERAGNASLPATIMALEALYGYQTGLDLKQLRTVARVIAEESGEPIARNAPVIGVDLFDVEAGIAAAYLEAVTPIDRRYFYPYLPEVVGAEARITIGKGVGAANIRMTASRLGIEPPSGKEAELAAVNALKYAALKRHRLLTDEEFADILAGKES